MKLTVNNTSYTAGHNTARSVKHAALRTAELSANTLRTTTHVAATAALSTKHAAVKSKDFVASFFVGLAHGFKA
jgi:hypothetical protein